MEDLEKDVTAEFKTYFPPDSFYYRWHVYNIKERISNETSLSCPEFEPMEKWIWKIKLTSDGEDQTINLLFSMYPSYKCLVNLKITIVDMENLKSRRSVPPCSFKTSDSFHLSTSITVCELPQIATLCFSMNFTPIVYQTEVYEKVARTTCIRLQTLSNDLSKLLDCGLAYDVTFVLRGCEIRAHKAILCARSKTFAQMVRDKSLVEINDMDFHIFKYILHFLYAGTLTDVYLYDVEALYDAAINYEMLVLQKLCRNCLCSQLTVDNAAFIYRTVVKYKDQKWMADIWDVMKFYIKTATHSWQTLMYKEPNLYESILRDIDI